jgi:hypothetical protein
MDSNKVDMFMISNGKYFEAHHLGYVREKLTAADENKWMQIQYLSFKDPTVILIVSVLVGNFGIDRFIIGDVGIGLLKLFTCGGFFIGWIIDWFLIMGATREKNLTNFQRNIY